MSLGVGGFAWVKLKAAAMINEVEISLCEMDLIIFTVFIIIYYLKDVKIRESK